MIRLHQIAFRKLIHYPTFWILLGLHLLLSTLVVMGLENFAGSFELNGNKMSASELQQFGLFAFPDVWHNITFVAGFFKFILALIVIIDVTNDYSFRVNRQHIIDGLSHLEYVFSKLLVVLWLALVACLVLFLTGLQLGIAHTAEVSSALIFEKISFVGGYFVELLTYLSLALLIAIIVKRSGLSIGLLILYSWIIEPLLGFFLPDHIQIYLPIENLGALIEMPYKGFFGEIPQNHVSWSVLGIALLYFGLFNLATYFYVSKKDL